MPYFKRAEIISSGFPQHYVINAKIINKLAYFVNFYIKISRIKYSAMDLRFSKSSEPDLIEFDHMFC